MLMTLTETVLSYSGAFSQTQTSWSHDMQAYIVDNREKACSTYLDTQF